MLTSTFSAYDALGNLLEKRKRTIVSNFECDVDPYDIGIWVENTGEFPQEGNVVPLYLTRDQVQEAQRNIER